MPSLLNFASETSATSGTAGTITLSGTASAGCQTWATAGVANGVAYSYGIRDGSSIECGIGVYGTASNTITRGTIRDSSAGYGTAISLSGTAVVYCDVLAEDIMVLPASATALYDDVISDVNIVLTAQALCNYNNYMNASAPDANDGDEYRIYFAITAGVYDIDLLGVTASSCGITDYYLDGTLIASGGDWYSSAANYNELKTIADVSISSGQHILTIKINGKNASSSDYRWLFQRMVIE